MPSRYPGWVPVHRAMTARISTACPASGPSAPSRSLAPALRVTTPTAATASGAITPKTVIEKIGPCPPGYYSNGNYCAEGRLAAPSGKRRSAMRQANLRRLWDARQSLTRKELVQQWQRYVRGWWNYFRLADAPAALTRLDSWVRRHRRKCFWLRWHNRHGRHNALKRLRIRGRALRTASRRKGAWRIARADTTAGAVQPHPPPLWIVASIRPRRRVNGGRVQPPDAENRTSGGVGGLTGAIPSARPDQWRQTRVVDGLLPLLLPSFGGHS
jgi:hypothetical protein